MEDGCIDLECSRAPDYTNIGFLGRWGTYARPQCLPSDTVPIRSWTRTLRPPGIRRRHLPYDTIPSDKAVPACAVLPASKVSSGAVARDHELPRL